MIKRRVFNIVVLMVGIATVSSTVWADTGHQEPSLDEQLAVLLDSGGVTALTPAAPASPEMVSLGEALFWDPILSGNKDISCATCHHPLFGTGDSNSLPYGTKAVGIGPMRNETEEGGEIIARNAPELFNKGDALWTSMFWDSRVSGSPEHGFLSPAGNQLPAGLDSVLAVQAMFPVTVRDEMRGAIGDTDKNGAPNELARFADDDLPAIWDAIMDRVLNLTIYQSMFRAAYPTLSPDDLGFQHAANAIAAYETATFSFYDSPWDLYLAGDTGALSDDQKRGAVLFYGKAGCVRCHAGPLMSDQLHHNIGLPQIGPGVDDTGLDTGRVNITGDKRDTFAFRTAPLRNVAVTGPWMHNGAYTTLEAAVRHMMDPVSVLAAYDTGQLKDDLLDSVRADPAFQEQVLATLDPMLKNPTVLTDEEFSYLMAFLNSLTSPSVLDLSDTVLNAAPSELVEMVGQEAQTTPIQTEGSTSTETNDPNDPNNRPRNPRNPRNQPGGNPPPPGSRPPNQRGGQGNP